MDLETKIFSIFYLLSKYRFNNWSKTNIKKYQNIKRNQIVKYAKTHSKFFKSYYNNIENFYSLPKENKKIMMDNLSDYNTIGLVKKELIDFALEVETKRDFSKRFKNINIGMSSGTSGNKGIVITTKQEERYLKSMYMSRLTLPKEKFNVCFILRVSSPAFNFNKFGHKLTYINQLQPLNKITNELEKISPNVLSAPPSMLKLLTEEFLKGKLKIKPKLIYSYAEVLHNDIKTLIENTFNVKVFQIYQGSEGCYALSCKKGNLHINEDIVYFELLDKKGNPTPDGEPCFKLLVTDLHKKSQPIIRYELNDILTLSKKSCDCGSHFRVIENIQGRSNDLFWGINNKETHFIYQDYISRAIITSSDEIEDFQAIQEDYLNITIKLVIKNKKNIKKIKQKITSKIKNIFKKYKSIEPHVKIILSKPVANINSNKLIRIICNIKNEKK